jgi:hypothetical protein
MLQRGHKRQKCPKPQLCQLQEDCGAKKKNTTGGTAENDPMPRVVTSNQIDQARHTSTH